MKRFVNLVIAASLLSFGWSCQQEQLEPAVSQNEGTIEISIELADALQTKSDHDGSAVTMVWYEVYDNNNTRVFPKADADRTFPAATDADPDENRLTLTDGKATLQFQPLKNRAYKILFWAMSGTDAPYTWSTLDNISMNYDESGKRDAFYGSIEVLGQNTSALSVTLQRPFALINFGGATDEIVIDNDAPCIKTVIGDKVTYHPYSGAEIVFENVGTAFSVMSGAPVSDTAEDLTLTYNSLALNPGTAEGQGYLSIKNEDETSTDYVYMTASYILAPADGTTIDMTATFKCLEDGTAETSFTYPLATVPVQANHRTNILGRIFTGSGQLTVSMIAGWTDYDKELWNGETQVITPAEDNVYVVTTAEQLAWVAQQVNTGADTFAGKTVRLGADIDLTGSLWTPIGTLDCTFDGIFDGNGHTISNLKINKQNGRIALFAYATNEIKNLEIHNADVYGYGTNVSVVAAHDNYKSLTMSNIKLTGLIKVEGLQNVASVMGYNYGSLTDIVVDVDEGSYVKSTSTDSGADNHVGGVIGYLAEGSGGMKNVKSNIDVIATKGNGIAGGLVGLLQYNNKLEYCSCSGDVTLMDVGAGSENRPYRIGGIAGTWMSSTGTTELSGCSYSGSLKSTSTIEFDYNGLVGRAWNTTHTGGKLIVDGDDWTTFGAEYDEDTQTYNVSNIQGLRYVCETFTNQSIVKVKLTEDIILNEDAVFDPIARSVSLDYSLELDGNGKTISNLKFDSEGKDQGLFSQLGGTVKNLHFKNVRGTAVGRLAALAGQFCGKIEGCTIDGISLSVTEDRVGAFVGLSYGTTISGCKVTNATISASEGHAGGLVGTIGGGASDTYSGNTIEGTITSIGYNDSVHALYGGLADSTSVATDSDDNVTTGVTLVTAE